MQFIYPEFLFALVALAIPIIVHLFNFRRFRKIYFTNVRFLREIKQDTQSRSRLKHLLVLASRLLALTFLVLAFAQPIIPANKQHAPAGQKRISVYVDNSFSMDAVGKNGNLLETAKKKAREIAGAYKPSDQFQLLTTSFEGRHQRLVNRDEFLTLVDEIKPNASVRNLTEVIARQNEALSSGSAEKVSKTAYVISDFQQANTNLNELKEDSALQISLVPVEASAQNNLYIDTCSLFTPFVQLNVPNDLIVEVRNAGDKTAENIPVKLMINGVQKALASVTVPEKEKLRCICPSPFLNPDGKKRK
ncbi:MAG: BatA and WFA domain-containing protein [Bacteroidetes bacterium]|nr:BatA and WFA domain-containing protein [Bacteroidota bacterium]